jgi:hypothetical protein
VEPERVKKPTPRARKSTAKSTGTTPAKIPQPHGGALNAGGTPGNVGGTGRPASVIRDRLRGSFDDRIAFLEKVTDGAVESTVADRLKAIDMLARYGLGVKDETTVRVVDPEVRARVRWMFDVVRGRESWPMRDLLEALMPVWSTGSTVPEQYLHAEKR